MRTKLTLFVIDNTVIIEFQEYCYSWNFLFDPLKMSLHDTVEKMKFSTRFSSVNVTKSAECLRPAILWIKRLRIWPHLLKKPLWENLIFLRSLKGIRNSDIGICDSLERLSIFTLHGTKYSRMDQVKFLGDGL